MNYERINELEKFAEDFYRKLDDAHSVYQKSAQEDTRSQSVKLKERRKKSPKKKVFTENIFKDPPAWKPPTYNTKEFEQLKILPPKILNMWESHRIHLLERSYVKEKDLPLSKNFAYTKNYGREFGDKKDLNGLSELGKSIVQKFIRENQIKENKLKNKEEEIEVYKHSKPPVIYNSWKFSNNIIEEFSKSPADKVYSYRTEPKKKFFLDEPFRRPKQAGEYFDKSVKLI